MASVPRSRMRCEILSQIPERMYVLLVPNVVRTVFLAVIFAHVTLTSKESNLNTVIYETHGFYICISELSLSQKYNYFS